MKNIILCDFIIRPIFVLLKFINIYTKNWGFSIILITIFIKMITYSLNKTQYISILKLNMLKPELEKINKKCINKNIKNKEIIDLYKKKNINLLYSFVLFFIQIPIFFSLYFILTNFSELNNARFILWINDLSSKDPYYILPILMGISIFYIQFYSPDNYNEKFSIFKIIIPIIFTIFFIYAPSGLVLYYLINNLVTIFQQKIIYNEFIKFENKLY